MKNITLKDVKRFLLHKQHLTDDVRDSTINQVVKEIGGLHATGSSAPYLSLFNRIPDFKKEHLDFELYHNKNLGKIRCIRKTLYLLPKELIPIYFRATHNFVDDISSKFMEAQGVSLDVYKTISKDIINLLKDRELSVADIKKNLDTNLNISVIINLMCDQGFLLRTKPRYYVIFNEFFPDINLNAIDENEAINFLVKQYLSSFGPVLEDDIFWWTGLGKMKIRNALKVLQKELIEIKISELKGKHILLKTDLELLESLNSFGNTHINVLPALDPYPMGYKIRDRYLDYQHYNYIFDRTGNITSIILVNGKIIGIWDAKNTKDSIIKFFLFEKVDEDVINEIKAKLIKVGLFLTNHECEITECGSMIPLTKRTAGSFLKPLEIC